MRRLEFVRRVKRLPQSTLAHQLGVSHDLYSRVERGLRAVLPGDPLRRRLEVALNTPASDLFDDNGYALVLFSAEAIDRSARS